MNEAKIKTSPVHDDDIHPDAILCVNICVHENVLRSAKPDENGWVRINDHEQAVVTLKLSPNGWRGFARALSKYPSEPEWRLSNAAIKSGEAPSAWSECRGGESGPGAWMHDDSCLLEIWVVDFARQGNQRGE